MTFTPIPEEPDRVPGALIAWAFAVTLMTIIACAGVVWLLQPESPAVQPAPPAQPFEGATSLEIQRALQHRDLDHWTWADRARARVRAPVDVAIDRYLAGAR